VIIMRCHYQVKKDYEDYNNEQKKKTNFVYKEESDYIIVYNIKPIDAGINGYFEFAYKNKKNTAN